MLHYREKIFEKTESDKMLYDHHLLEFKSINIFKD
jgi:hypothetical protein